MPSGKLKIGARIAAARQVVQLPRDVLVHLFVVGAARPDFAEGYVGGT